MSQLNVVHTPNSPLLPLSPMPFKTPSLFLSPCTVSLGSRRFFTPGRLNVLPPPNLSPIRAGISKSCDSHDDSKFIFKRPLTRKTMKNARPSTRKFEVRNTHTAVPFDSFRCSSFGEGNLSPIAHLKPPQPKYSASGTPQRHSSAAAGAAAGSFASPYLNVSHEVPSHLLDENFTVESILKEINMQKYANLFVKDEFDLIVFLMLTQEDMIELDIEVDDRAILIGAINSFKEFFNNSEKNLIYMCIFYILLIVIVILMFV